ncbi:hypothetical protein LQ384_24695 [Rhodococcus rhodochrous]|uniref:Mce-associated membrane protein n=1 Tax=Rhodococcus rhodochrous TaxID=1829 RepID=A0AAW4XN29_RHORH|nr:hypothetical protein [Rhodococcus rhodochrous]MCD2114312.1 hypothetical protein [Rhodococcus rhodochrous]
MGVLTVLAVSWGAHSSLSPQKEVAQSGPADSEPSISPTSAPPTTTVASPPAAAAPTPSPATQAAEDAARQGLTVMFTWYPTTDRTQNDAYGRARDWLTDSLAQRMTVDARTERGPSVQWAHWAEQQTKVIADVSIECSGCPEDTDTVIRRVATIKQTAVSDSGTETVHPDTTVWVTIVRVDDRWLIDEIRY